MNVGFASQAPFSSHTQSIDMQEFPERMFAEHFTFLIV